MPRILVINLIKGKGGGLSVSFETNCLIVMDYNFNFFRKNREEEVKYTETNRME